MPSKEQGGIGTGNVLLFGTFGGYYVAKWLVLRRHVALRCAISPGPHMF